MHIADFIVRSSVYKFIYRKRVLFRVSKLASNPPLFMDIEGTNACNADCIMCPHSIMKRKIGIMDWDLFKKVADDCRENGVKEIALNGFGEPLLDPKIFQKIKYLKDIGIPKVSIYSNASLITEDRAESLVLSGLDILDTCMDGINCETFNKIRKGIGFNNVVGGINTLLLVREKLKKKNPSVYVGFVLLRENEKEKKEFIDRWRGIADGVYIALPANWCGAVDINRAKSLIDDFHCTQLTSPCIFLWKGMYVQWNGDVVMCCRDYEGRYVLGNLKNENIEDIWYGEPLKSVRELHLKGKRELHPLCVRCLDPGPLAPTAWWHV